MKTSFPKFSTLRFIFIAVVFMLLADHFVFGGKRSYIEDAKTIERHEERLAQPEAPKPPPVRVKPDKGTYFEQVPEEKPVVAEAPPPETVPEEIVPEVVQPKLNGAKIAIIIDDVGMDVKHSRQVIEQLPAGVTLAFLPYAPKTRELAAKAKAKGHTLIIHAPMEAMDPNLNIGPGGLKSGMSASEFDAAFKIMMESFDGYVGINNHMGSKLTQDKTKMDALMAILAKRGLFFVDSKTIQSSVAAHEAAEAGVKYAERDVFLDHVESRAFVDKALAQAERVAAKKGYAIAIGHPKSFTIEGLKAWIPTLAAKGIELVPVSALLTTPKIASVKEKDAPTGVPESDPLALPRDVPQAAPKTVSPSPQASEAPAPSVDMFPEIEDFTPSAGGEILHDRPPPPAVSP